MVFLTEERRNNMAERLLQNDPPALTMVWLTTFSEIKADPTRPLPYPYPSPRELSADFDVLYSIESSG